VFAELTKPNLKEGKRKKSGGNRNSEKNVRTHWQAATLFRFARTTCLGMKGAKMGKRLPQGRQKRNNFKQMKKGKRSLNSDKKKVQMGAR